MTAALAITHCMELTQGRYSAPTLKSQLHSEASRHAEHTTKEAIQELAGAKPKSTPGFNGVNPELP